MRTRGRSRLRRSSSLPTASKRRALSEDGSATPSGSSMPSPSNMRERAGRPSGDRRPPCLVERPQGAAEGLHDRAVRDGGVQGQAAALEHLPSSTAGFGQQLPAQPGLPDPLLARQDDRPTASRLDRVQRRPHPLHFGAPSGQHRAQGKGAPHGTGPVPHAVHGSGARSSLSGSRPATCTVSRRCSHRCWRLRTHRHPPSTVGSSSRSGTVLRTVRTCVRTAPARHNGVRDA